MRVLWSMLVLGCIVLQAFGSDRDDKFPASAAYSDASCTQATGQHVRLDKRCYNVDNTVAGVSYQSVRGISDFGMYIVYGEGEETGDCSGFGGFYPAVPSDGWLGCEPLGIDQLVLNDHLVSRYKLDLGKLATVRFYREDDQHCGSPPVAVYQVETQEMGVRISPKKCIPVKGATFYGRKVKGIALGGGYKLALYQYPKCNDEKTDAYVRTIGLFDKCRSLDGSIQVHPDSSSFQSIQFT